MTCNLKYALLIIIMILPTIIWLIFYIKNVNK